MQIILSAIFGIFIGILFMGLISIKRVSDLVFERNYYRKALRNEKIKVEQRDVLIKDIIKESVTTTNQTTNS